MTCKAHVVEVPTRHYVQILILMLCRYPCIIWCFRKVINRQERYRAREVVIFLTEMTGTKYASAVEYRSALSGTDDRYQTSILMIDAKYGLNIGPRPSVRGNRRLLVRRHTAPRSPICRSVSGNANRSLAAPSLRSISAADQWVLGPLLSPLSSLFSSLLSFSKLIAIFLMP